MKIDSNLLDMEQIMLDPQPGYHFQQIMHHHVYVVERLGNAVIACSGSIPALFPEDAEFTYYNSVEDFAERYSYITKDGYWVKLHERNVDVSGWLDGAALTVYRGDA